MGNKPLLPLIVRCEAKRQAVGADMLHWYSQSMCRSNPAVKATWVTSHSLYLPNHIFNLQRKCPRSPRLVESVAEQMHELIEVQLHKFILTIPPLLPEATSDKYHICQQSCQTLMIF